jgi:type II secretory pathway component PulK
MAALWAVLVLGILAALTAAATRQFALLRRTADQREARLQATWLARSGIELAIAKLAADENYRGETVKLASGKCRITVTQADDRYRISCEATLSSHRSSPIALAESRTVKRLDANDVRIELLEHFQFLPGEHRK